MKNCYQITNHSSAFNLIRKINKTLNVMCEVMLCWLKLSKDATVELDASEYGRCFVCGYGVAFQDRHPTEPGQGCDAERLQSVVGFAVEVEEVGVASAVPVASDCAHACGCLSCQP